MGAGARAIRMKKAATHSGKTTTPKKKAVPPAPAEPSVATPSQREQSELFGRAIALFREARFAQARELFEKAAAGPIREMGHAARTHARICEQRLGLAASVPSTAEDHYNLGVALINRRDLEPAERHLREALKLEPARDHIHYALALAQGLRGDVYGAVESLKRAIELEPRVRRQARNDPDFAGLLHNPPLAALLRVERDYPA